MSIGGPEDEAYREWMNALEGSNGGTHSPQGEDLGHLRERLRGQVATARGLRIEVQRELTILDKTETEDQKAALDLIFEVYWPHVNVYRSDNKPRPTQAVIAQVEAALRSLEGCDFLRKYHYLPISEICNHSVGDVIARVTCALRDWQTVA